MVKRDSQELRDARRAGVVQSISVSLWFIFTGAFWGAAWFAPGGPTLGYPLLGTLGLMLGGVFMASVVRTARAVGRAEEIADQRERWRRPARSLAN